MYRALKLIHILGFALFLGSIMGHIVAARVAPGTADPAVLIYARDTVILAARAVTLPGLAMIIVSGIAMTRLGPADLPRQGWFRAHSALSVPITVATLAIIAAASDLADLSRALAAGRGSLAGFAGPEAVERGLGAVNILAILASAAVAVVRRRARPVRAVSAT